jgi:cysteine desulfuration protein SufE
MKLAHISRLCGQQGITAVPRSPVAFTAIRVYVYPVPPNGQRSGMTHSIGDITENFGLLEDWEDRYRYLIELGRTLEPLAEAELSDANKVRGCASQVWLVTALDGTGPDARLTFRGESDAHIVRGLIAIIIALYSGRSARAILTTDPEQTFEQLGLRNHLTPQRSNGLASMVQRIRADAAAAAGA